jgi:hypothetical protein
MRHPPVANQAEEYGQQWVQIRRPLDITLTHRAGQNGYDNGPVQLCFKLISLSLRNRQMPSVLKPCVLNVWLFKIITTSPCRRMGKVSSPSPFACQLQRVRVGRSIRDTYLLFPFEYFEVPVYGIDKGLTVVGGGVF